MGDGRWKVTDKRARMDRLAGNPRRVSAEPVRAKIHQLHSQDGAGMTYRAIAAQAGLDYSTIASLANPARQYAHRYTAEAVMRTHAPFTMIGITRRLQALCAIGFPGAYIAQRLGCNAFTLNNLRKPKAVDHRGARKGSWSSHSPAIVELYKELEAKDPHDYGFDNRTVGVGKARARQEEYAPPVCWDPDTIDNPKAIAEWTGVCGTAAGRERHRVLGQKACAPCRKAHNAYVSGRRHQDGLDSDVERGSLGPEGQG